MKRFLIALVLVLAAWRGECLAAAQINITGDGVANVYTASGLLPEAVKTKTVSLCVRADGGNALYYATVYTNSCGEFIHKFMLPKAAGSGYYTIYASAYNGKALYSQRFLHNKKSDYGAFILLQQQGSYIQNIDDACFDVYLSSDKDAEYKITYEIDGKNTGELSVSVMAENPVLKTVSLCYLPKGVYTLKVNVKCGAELVSSDSADVAFVSKYREEALDSFSKIGVHTALSDTGSAINNKQLDILSFIGVKNIRTGRVLRWGNIEQYKDSYSFESANINYLEKLINCGFNIVVGTGANSLYGGIPKTDEEIAAYQKYIKVLLNSVPNIKAFEVWNEPNSKTFFSGTTEDYIRLVKAAALAVEASGKNIDVIAGSVDSGGGAFNAEMLSDGAYPYIGDFAFHPYLAQSNGMYGNPDEQYNSWVGQHINRQNSCGAWLMPHITEIGWPTAKNAAYPVSEEEQAQYLVKSFVYNYAMDIKSAYWYDYRNDGTSTSDTESNFGIVTNSLMPKKALPAFAQLTQTLNNAFYIGKTADIYQKHIFIKGGKLIACQWSEGEPVTVNIGENQTLYDINGNKIPCGDSFCLETTPVYLFGITKTEAKAAVINDVKNRYAEITSAFGSAVDSSDFSDIISRLENTEISDTDGILALVKTNYGIGYKYFEREMADSDRALLLYMQNSAGKSISSLMSLSGGSVQGSASVVDALYEKIVNKKQAYKGCSLKYTDKIYAFAKEYSALAASGAPIGYDAVATELCAWAEKYLEMEVPQDLRLFLPDIEVKFLRFTDSDKNTVVSAEDGNIRAEFDVIYRGGTGNVTLVLSGYSADGRLCGTAVKTVSVSGAYNITLDRSLAGAKVKAFAADSNCAPLTELCNTIPVN